MMTIEGAGLGNVKGRPFVAGGHKLEDEMRYIGNKGRIAKEIVPIMQAAQSEGQAWVEPFGGACGSLSRATGWRIYSDRNEYIAALMRAVAEGWEPPEVVCLEAYRAIKATPQNYTPHLVGFVGFGCSFGGKFFGGYARGGMTAKGLPRNYAGESARDLKRLAPLLKGIEFNNLDYRELALPERSLIYCDPPYFSTQGYCHDIDHAEFWNWVQDRGREGHTVFVSEYAAPEFMVGVWAKEVKNTLDLNTGAKAGTERLFRYAG